MSSNAGLYPDVPIQRPRVVPSLELLPLDLSIVIVTWNSERWIRTCLEAIPQACGSLRYEVVICDNASTDGTLTPVVGLNPRTIPSARNDGFAAGVNRGAASSSGKFLLLLNPDCQLEPGSLQKLTEFLDRNPAAAAVTPLLVDEDGREQREFQLRDLPTLRSLATEILFHRRTSQRRYALADLAEGYQVAQPAAAAFLIRRSVFEAVGPFDQRFSPAWFEDVDYCKRLQLAGSSIFVLPQARARHFVGSSLEHMSFGMFIDIWYRNMFRYAQKWFKPAECEALRWVIVLGMLLRSLAALAGFAHPEAGRMQSFRAYVNVLRKALDRWDHSSRSSL